MAEFEYVTWDHNTPLSSDRLLKMSENDQHLKDLDTSGPKGVLGYSEHFSGRKVEGRINGVNWLATNSNLDTTVTIEEDRMVRATFYCQSIWGPSAGIADCRQRIRLDGERTFGWTKGLVWAKAENPMVPVSRVAQLTAGTHDFTVEVLVMPSAGFYGGIIWQAHAANPMYLMIEDLGTAI